VRALGSALVVALLLAVPPTAFGSTFNAASVAVSPNGSLLYAGFNGAGFTVFSRDATTGELSVAGEAQSTSSAGPVEDPAIAVSPDGTSVYGVDDLSNTLFQYGVGSSALTTQQTYPVLSDTSTAKAPTNVAVSPDGDGVYVLTYGVQFGTGVGVTSDGQVIAYQRDPATGNLTLVGNTQLPNAAAEGVVGRDLALPPDGNFIYVADNAVGGVSVFSRNATTEAVSPVGTGGNLNGAVAVAISPDGNFVYEAGEPSSSSSLNSAIGVLSRNTSNGGLTPVSEVQNGSGGVFGLSDIWSLAVSPDGQCLYATSRADNTLGYFSRNPGTGALTFGGVVTEGTGGVSGLAGAREVTTYGDDIYVASSGDNGVAVFDRSSSSTCVPTFNQLVQDLFTLQQPTVDPSSGTATLPVNVLAAGTLEVVVAPIGEQPSARPRQSTTQTIQVSNPGLVNAPVSVTGQAEQQLQSQHQLNVAATVTFTASGGTPTTKTSKIELKQTASSATQIEQALTKLLAEVRHTVHAGTIVRSGDKLAFLAPEGGRLTIGWEWRSKQIATAALTVHASGRTTVKVKLTSAGRRLLRQSKHLRVTAKATFTPTGAAAVSARRMFTLIT
jgi:6-phosphogluconolactonase (cycloisomerase 2 family)